MKYEIQVFKTYLVEASEVATTLESIKTAGEQLIRIKEHAEVSVADVPA
jgi:hypothetical protein